MWQWEYEQSPGYWCPMEPEFSAYLTHRLWGGVGGVNFDHQYPAQAEAGEWQWRLAGSVPYTIDFNFMYQRNNQTRTVRRLRIVHVLRCAAPWESFPEDDETMDNDLEPPPGHCWHQPPPQESCASTSCTAGTAGTSTSVSSDCE